MVSTTFQGLAFSSAIALLSTAACAPKTPPQATGTQPAPATPIPAAAPATAAAPAKPAAPATTAVAAAASEELPDGPGRKILLGACTQCHNLREVTKFRGFYGRAQWRDIVLTMVDYGAPVGEKDVEVLTDYLTTTLSKK